MYGFLPSPATHAEPLDWTRLTTSALAVVKMTPSEPVLNALAMMHAYATASPTVFTNLTRGVRDVKEYVALLTAFDDAVGAWPLRLRQLLALPPVALVSVGGGVNGSLMTVPVRTARGEALVFLMNVAIGHLENGLAYLARVHADTAAATSVTTPQGGSVAAPNQNAKIAAQHFKQGVEVLRWAESLHAAPASPSALTLQQLHAQLPLDVTLGMAVLSAAVAKYMYALSSASTKNKPDVLAQLAFAAAQLPLPTSVLSSSSLQLLPSLLLAAYHYHQATWYYAHATAKAPEMAEALGHVRYANTLLRTCDQQWKVEEVHQEAEDESRQWWGRRLASLLTGAGKTKAKSNAAQHARTGGSTNDAEEDAVDEDSEVPLKPAKQYPHLYGLLRGESAGPAGSANMSASPPDVVQVFPYMRLLLNDVCTALQQYERENRIVYFAKVTPADEVRRDVPDVAPSNDAPAALESAVFESSVRLFASLPSPAALQAALAQQDETGEAQQTLSRALQRVELDGRRLANYVTPTAALEQALDSLEGLLPAGSDWASPQVAVAVAADAINAAGNAFKEVAAEWQEAHDVYVGDRCAPPPSVKMAMGEIMSWTQRATTALELWAGLRIPDTVNTRAGFVGALVPRSAQMAAHVEKVEAMSRDVRDVLAAEVGTVTRAQVQSAVEALEKVKLVGTELLAAAAAESNVQSRGTAPANREGDELRVSPQYEKAEAAVLAVVAVLEEAPMVVAHVDAAAAQLTAMQQKAVVVPLGRVPDVHFRTESADIADAMNDVPAPLKRARSDVAAAPAAKTAKPTRPRITGLPRPAAAATVSSSPSASSRKRDRPDSPPALATDGDSGDDAVSVSSSQLDEAQEAPPAPGDGATHAKVSDSLLRRMKANKLRSQQAQPSAGAAAAKSAKTERSPAKR